MKRPRRDHVPAIKAMGPLEIPKGEKTLAHVAAHYCVLANQIASWVTPAASASVRYRQSLKNLWVGRDLEECAELAL
jgi:hypothetical protein